MVRDGIYYALGMGAVAAVLAWLATPWLVLPPLLLAAFFLWFFRDPERAIPQEPGLVVSPADGKVTEVSTVAVDGVSRHRISIFLNVFDVHVNRAPIGGVIVAAEYKRGKFTNAMGALSAEHNEQNVVTVEGEGQRLVFKQIAGLLARRIVFIPKVGERVERGQRIGMMKFGSRMDVVMEDGVAPAVKAGERVLGGVSVIGRGQRTAARARAEIAEPILTGGR
jgi:phosphatidylserine decarboxylase